MLYPFLNQNAPRGGAILKFMSRHFRYIYNRVSCSVIWFLRFYLSLLPPPRVLVSKRLEPEIFQTLCSSISKLGFSESVISFLSLFRSTTSHISSLGWSKSTNVDVMYIKTKFFRISDFIIFEIRREFKLPQRILRFQKNSSFCNLGSIGTNLALGSSTFWRKKVPS